jgi:hypothetical protein
MGSIRTCLILEGTFNRVNKDLLFQEGSLYGVNKDLTVTRNYIIWGPKACPKQEVTLYVVTQRLSD